jgi:hypothetical protein
MKARPFCSSSAADIFPNNGGIPVVDAGAVGGNVERPLFAGEVQGVVEFTALLDLTQPQFLDQGGTHFVLLYRAGAVQYGQSGITEALGNRELLVSFGLRKLFRTCSAAGDHHCAGR